MCKKIQFLSKIILIVLFLGTNVYTSELSIIPLKKPILDKAIKDQKLTKNIITPLSKPKNIEKEANKEKTKIKKKINKKIFFFFFFKKTWRPKFFCVSF